MGLTIGNNIGIGQRFQQGAGLNQEAVAFITASGITDSTEKRIINDLITDFKTAGLWTKMKAVYPFLKGRTIDQCKYNLKDSRDLDAAYRITWNGTINNTSNGIVGNGINGYGNTHLNPNGLLAFNNIGFSVWSGDDTNAQGYCDIGAGAYQIITYRNSLSGGVFQAGSPFTAQLLGQYNNTKGLFSVNRIATNNQKTYRNGYMFADYTVDVTDPSINLPFYICAQNNGSPNAYSVRPIRFACIHEGLTEEEEFIKYAIIRKYIDAIDSNSAYNLQIQFESWQPSSINQVTLTMKVNTGFTVSVNWGDANVSDIVGDGTWQSVTSNYSTGSKTYYGRIYGDLSQLIGFKIDTEATVSGLNISDFYKLSIPLYSLTIRQIKSALIQASKLPLGLTELELYQSSTYCHGSYNNLPRYLTKIRITGDPFTADGWTNLPPELNDLNIDASSSGDVNIDHLPIGLKTFVLNTVSGVTGSLSNLPSSLTNISIVKCGNNIDISNPPLKAWSTTTITLTSGFTTTQVDGFFNSYSLVAGDGVATLNLAGSGAGIANQADSAASATAQTALTALHKTIQTN